MNNENEILISIKVDPTAGYVETPAGEGRFVYYDGNTHRVTVEIDNRYLVEYPADKVFVRKEEVKRYE